MTSNDIMWLVVAAFMACLFFYGLHLANKEDKERKQKDEA